MRPIKEILQKIIDIIYSETKDYRSYGWIEGDYRQKAMYSVIRNIDDEAVKKCVKDVETMKPLLHENDSFHLKLLLRIIENLDAFDFSLRGYNESDFQNSLLRIALFENKKEIFKKNAYLYKQLFADDRELDRHIRKALYILVVTLSSRDYNIFDIIDFFFTEKTKHEEFKKHFTAFTDATTTYEDVEKLTSLYGIDIACHFTSRLDFGETLLAIFKLDIDIPLLARDDKFETILDNKSFLQDKLKDPSFYKDEKIRMIMAWYIAYRRHKDKEAIPKYLYKYMGEFITGLIRLYGFDFNATKPMLREFYKNG